MCGRYTNTGGPEELNDRFRVPITGTAGTRRFNIAPTEEVLAIVAPKGEPEARLLRWGLIPPWAKDLKGGAKMINAVTNSGVPHLTVIMGSSYGAGNYGMCGRAYGPRFLFAWPNSRLAVMGPQQLAGVLSIVARQAADAAGRPFDEAADAAQRATVEAQIERESQALYNTGKVYDDGIIDPRDTRTVLGIALSAVHSNVVEGRRGFGVFRM